MAKLEFENINFLYKDGVNGIYDGYFKIETGQVIPLIGESGSGKSTLVKILLGELQGSYHARYTDKNDVGKNVNPSDLSSYIRFGFAPQKDPLNSEWTVDEYFDYYGKIQMQSNTMQERKERIDDTVEKLKLKKVRDNKIKDLSGGEKRRLNLGIELLSEKLEFIILDEPFNDLDPPIKRELMEYFLEIARRDDKCFLIVTHEDNTFIKYDIDYGLMIRDHLILPLTHMTLLKSSGFDVSTDNLLSCDLSMLSNLLNKSFFSYEPSEAVNYGQKLETSDNMINGEKKMRRNYQKGILIIGVIILIIFFGVFFFWKDQAKAAKAVYGIYNPKNGDHYFTIDHSTIADLKENGWTHDDVAFFQATSGGIPIYRLYNTSSGEHFITRNLVESNKLIAAGWVNEGSAWNAPISGKPVYRLFNLKGFHYWTADEAEKLKLIASGWRDEGIAFYT